MKLEWENPRFRRGALLALVLMVVVLLVHEVFGEHGYLALRRQRREYEALQVEIQKLQDENARLEKEIKGLKSDPDAIEKLAREKMRLARPGEYIYVLPEKSETEKESAPPTPPDRR
jgi:cell division protein FtsB